MNPSLLPLVQCLFKQKQEGVRGNIAKTVIATASQGLCKARGQTLYLCPLTYSYHEEVLIRSLWNVNTEAQEEVTAWDHYRW